MMKSETDQLEPPLERLLAALPASVGRWYKWLCQPKLIWLRVPLGILLIGFGFLGFLPILGFWMLPVGVLLLAEDLPFLRRPTIKAIGAVQGWWDRRRQRS